ncbi:type II toxin-antitoxin system HigB family toxin [Dyadobacter sp. 676]|uniref:Type II toxin-antitoxin system HigB family toxin n=1 Tax=Dyadobacter sp. 676 TaxID=3088362 RepID=A0AAU8FBY4_9BACT
MLSRKRVVFNIHGNLYRLIVGIEYRSKSRRCFLFSVTGRAKSEILSGKRKLSLSTIRRLNEKLHIPAVILIQAY